MALSFQTYALSSLNANSRATAVCLLLSLCDLNNVNDVRRMNNGVFQTMSGKE
ncbi:hypothetical protein T06_8200 [Trichinella sp. T6]|nr:hypothetical protein T06_16989 [Trichinella sp. T6]KRX39984.1 hypothetical protein T06_11192 [Trichinella sp. T6]KRX47372.1 hypothetical protein T06_5773 [Trichinella sp. T6]KRX51642.1 hypothetical protein T06_8200 [Trichinella sp. T6]